VVGDGAAGVGLGGAGSGLFGASVGAAVPLVRSVSTAASTARCTTPPTGVVARMTTNATQARPAAPEYESAAKRSRATPPRRSGESAARAIRSRADGGSTGITRRP
jgi:hypothetical protein